MKKNGRTAAVWTLAAVAGVALGLGGCGKSESPPPKPADQPAVEKAKEGASSAAKTVDPAAAKPKDHPAH